MFVYYQGTGDLLNNGNWVGRGYAGNGEWKNDPSSQVVKDHGPLPRGLYFMDKVDEEKGPVTIHLIPSGYNEMFDRSGFLIHGDNPDHIGDSSDGCIIMSRSIREAMVGGLHDGENLIAVV